MHTLLDFMSLTKGVEYLIAIAFMVGFILFWKFVSQTRVQPVSARVADLAREIGETVGGFLLPGGAYFHPGHTWVRIDDNNIATVGLDDFAQKLVGRIDAVHLPDVGSTVRQGEKAWSVEADSRPIDMLSPVDGEILSVNGKLTSSPETLNADPYGKGWLLRVRAPRISANVKNLLSGNLARRWIEEARENLLSKGGYDVGLVYQDGGLPIDGMARNLDQQGWDAIAKEFFLVSDE